MIQASTVAGEVTTHLTWPQEI